MSGGVYDVRLRGVASGQQSYEKLSQQWRAVGDTAYDVTGPVIKPQTSASIAVSFAPKSKMLGLNITQYERATAEEQRKYLPVTRMGCRSHSTASVLINLSYFFQHELTFDTDINWITS